VVLLFALGDAAVELVDDAGDVGAGFAIGRDAVVAVNGVGAGVVGGESEGEVVVVAGEELVKIGGSALEVLGGLEAVLDTELVGCAGHQLHESLGSGAGDGAGLATAFSFDDGGEEIFIDVVVGAGGGEELGEVGGSERGVGGEGIGRGIGGDGWRGGQDFYGGDGFGGEIDVIGVAGLEVGAEMTLDEGVVVADEVKAVGEPEAFRGAGGKDG
jgi:hypothetical protein